MPDYQVGQTARNPQTGEVVVWSGNGWVPQQSAPQAPPEVVVRRANPRAENADAYQSESSGASSAATANRTRALTPYEVQRAATEARIAQIQERREAAELEAGPAPRTVDIALQGKNASLNTLVEQINEAQDRFERGPGATSGVFGLGDYFPTEANTRFDTVGSGLVETAFGAFRVPGAGGQSDADLRLLLEANQPSSSSRDAANEERLAYLRRRADNARAEAGLPPAEWLFDGRPQRDDNAAPLSLSQTPGAQIPNTAGVQNDPGAQVGGVAAVGSADGMRRDPRLAGLSGELRRMLAGGASLRDVMGHFTARRAQAGYSTPDPEQAGLLAMAHARLRQNPRTNLNDILEGWENFENVRGEEAPSALRSAAGAVADTDVGAFAANGLNSLFAGAPAQFVDGGTAIMDAQRYERPIASISGDLTGAVGSMIGINRFVAPAVGRFAPAAGRFLSAGGGIGGDAAYGAARGAIDAPEGTDIGERALRGALGAGTGAAGNAVGRGLVNAGGRALRGVSDPAVRLLSERGVPLTLGQTLGNRGMFGRTMNKAESIPILGDLMGARRTDGFEGFARAASNDAVAPIGMTAGPRIGAEGVDDLMAQTGQGFDNALNGVSIPRDAQLGQGLASASGRVAPDNPLRGDFDRIMGEELRPAIFGGPTISGRQFQDINRSTRAYARRYGDAADSASPPLPSARPVGQAFGEIADTFDNALARSNPDALPAYRGAQQAYRNVSVIRDATNAARNGSGSNQTDLFTPAQLSTAAARNAQRYGGTQGTTNQPFFDLTRAGQEVLPSTVPNSATADRGMVAMALPALFGGGAAASSYLSGDVVNPTTATLAALAALSTRGGARATQTALVSRSPVFQTIGNRVVRNTRYGGMFGAAGGSATTPVFLPELLAGQ
jgi:hypothetical protein